MKKGIVFAVMLLALFSLTFNASAYERVVLLEEFTSTT